MKATRSIGTALERAAEFLDTEVERTGTRGERKVVLERPGRLDAVVYVGKPAEVLYGLVYAASTPEVYGGHGYDFDELHDAIKLTKVPSKGMSAHQTHLFRALTGRSS